MTAGGLYHLPAVFPENSQVVLGHGVLIHLGVHGWGEESGALAGQHRGGEHVVGNTVGQFGGYVGGGRSHHDYVRLLGQGDVLHVELEAPVKGVYRGLVAGEGLKDHGGDKAGGVLGHEHMDVGVLLHQQRS